MESAMKKVATIEKRTQSLDLSPLEVAVENNMYELAEFFLKKAANDDDLGTSLEQINNLLKQKIKGLNRSPSFYPFIQLLVWNNALEADKDRESFSGRTPLDEAVTHGHKDVAQLLLEHGADVNYIQCVGDMSSLVYAIHDKTGDKFKESMAFLLIKYGADLTYRSGDGSTVLDACNGTGRMDIMQLVIAANPMDMHAFKKALRIAFIWSRVPRPDQDKLVIPNSMKAMHMHASVPLLLRAIDNADLLLLNKRAMDIPRDPAPERGVGGAPAAAPDSHGKPTAADYDSIFGERRNVSHTRDTTPIHRAPERGVGGAPAPERDVEGVPAEWSVRDDRVPTHQEWQAMFGKASEKDFDNVSGSPRKASEEDFDNVFGSPRRWQKFPN